jgi:predicted polyphosphate/ATP-dependent NAD kinase
LVEQIKDSTSKNKATQKLDAELKRSLAVAKVKAAHKEIEDIGKTRKRAMPLSICKRVDSLLQIMQVFITLNKPEFEHLQLTEYARSIVKNFEKTYLSIRYDFQKNLDIGDEGMANTFPLIKVDRDNFGQASSDLTDVSMQVTQMKNYCERLLT